MMALEEMTMDQVRIALCGAPGAGKSTVARMMREFCETESIFFGLIKLADPLYEIQSLMYQLAGRKLDWFYRKDAELLNFLGYYMRRINPAALHERALVRLTELGLMGGRRRRVIVCDDARASDIRFLRNLAFVVVRVDAPENVCAMRCRLRGDVTVLGPEPVTERGLHGITPDHVVDNARDEDVLRQHVVQLLDSLVGAAV